MKREEDNVRGRVAKRDPLQPKRYPLEPKKGPLAAKKVPLCNQKGTHRKVKTAKITKPRVQSRALRRCTQALRTRTEVLKFQRFFALYTDGGSK